MAHHALASRLQSGRIAENPLVPSWVQRRTRPPSAGDLFGCHSIWFESDRGCVLVAGQ